MKKHIVTLLIISVFAGVSAQSYTQAFDSVFQHVDLRHTSTGILYERVLPLSNLTSYVTNIPHPVDTCDFWQFVMAYDELYRAGAQNTFLSDSVEGMINSLPLNNDIVTFGILHAKFNTFDTAAMRQRLYFDADSVLWEDISVPVSLFNENITFMMAPLVEHTSSPSVSFFIDHHFHFDNTNNPVTSLTIDFGDGHGKRNVLFDTYVNINYSTNGIKIIRTVASFFNRDTIITYSLLKVGRDLREGRSSHYNYTEDLTVYGQIIPPYPYSDGGHFSYSRGDMRIYYANPDKKLRKPVLIVDGFDPENNRTFEDNTNDDEKSLWDKLGDGLANNDNVGELLLSLGYDVVLLDFPEGGTYIEQNAMVCIAAINKINERLQQSGSNEQIVLVGPSMGGQITRYAVAYMEQNPDANTNYGKHNCRLWISFDSPHQGANISMGAQAMVDYFRNKEENDTSDISLLWNNTLCSIAAQQMLIHHKKYGASAYNHMYYQQIANLGYPNNIRKLAVSNGSLNNTPNGVPYQIAFEIVIATHILGYTMDVRIRNMVSVGSGQVFSATHWIGIVPIHVTWSFINDGGRGSLDVAPGCQYNTFDRVESTITNRFIKLINWYIVNFAINQHTHCFMPITSVLDINEPIPYATDVSNRDLIAEGKIPFDSYWGPLNKNMEHITFDYDLVEYLLNEIETYIQGPREVQECSHTTYTLHLPQDSIATVTWQSSSNIHVVTGSNPYSVTIIPLGEGDGWISAEVSTLKHRKSLAHYPVHILPYENNTIPAVSSTTIQGQSMTISTNSLLIDTFCIENGKTLTVTGTLYCAPSTRIIVRPGGKLIVDGGTLTSACDDVMWQGIEVVGDRTKRQLPQYQGKVVLRNGAVIENALCALRTSLREDTLTFATAGGIIEAEEAVFRNNRQSVLVNSYAYTMGGTVLNYSAQFYHCNFVVDTSNLFASNNTSFSEHVKLWDVNGVSFNGCTFRNKTGNTVSNSRGIYAEDAGLSLDAFCRVNNQINCECPPNYTDSCKFSGFTTAVEVNTTGNPYPVRVEFCRFGNNGSGVRVNGNHFTTVTRCNFNLDTIHNNVMNTQGVVLNNSHGYKVEANIFKRTVYPSSFIFYDNCTGISVSNSGMTNNSLYRNTFLNLTKGIYVSGNNGNLKAGSLKMTCHYFYGNKYDIRLASGATVGTAQGSPSKGADNEFHNTSNTISNFYNPELPSITYYYYNGNTNLIPSSSLGLTLITVNTSNSCASTLCNNGGSMKSLTEFQSDMDADSYYESVRALMADSVLDLNALEQWHAAAQPIADPYSLTETRFMMGYNEPFVADADDAELANYAEFHAMKVSLRGQYDNTDNQDNIDSQNSPMINWYALTPAQISQLQTIAERNAGRASVMAKGVLCFFHGICYDDDSFVDDNVDNNDNNMETRSAKASPQDGETRLNVYPNPTDDLLFVELSGAGIQSAALFDLQGRVVTNAGVCDTPQRGTATMNLRSIPAGVYLLRVTDTEGREYHRKVVKR